MRGVQRPHKAGVGEVLLRHREASPLSEFSNGPPQLLPAALVAEKGKEVSPRAAETHRREDRRLLLCRQYFLPYSDTLIHLEDLIKGMLVSNNNEILAYATVFMGYLIGKIQEDPLCFASHQSHAVLQSFSEGRNALKQEPWRPAFWLIISTSNSKRTTVTPTSPPMSSTQLPTNSPSSWLTSSAVTGAS